MIKTCFARFGVKLVLLSLLAWPQFADAQLFNYNDTADVLLGFRKPTLPENYELVVDVGSITNFLILPAGTTISMGNFSPSQLTDAFPDGYGSMQWSAFCAYPTLTDTNYWASPVGLIPESTLWYTLPTSGVNTRSTAPNRGGLTPQTSAQTEINSVGYVAVIIAGFLNVTNADCNSVLLREPISYSDYVLTTYIGDSANPSRGDFGGNNTPLPYNIENVTPASFTAAQRCDFYQVCPTTLIDPLTGTTTGKGDFLGYFILNPDGTMTFTRAGGSVAAPVAGFSGTPLSGFAPLQVLFTDSSTGSITNWLWSFGDGQSVTNTTSTSVSHTYVAAGIYTVALTANGPGGSNTKTLNNYIVAFPTPTVAKVSLSGGNLVLSGTNCPAGVQYRILTTPTLSPANWTPVVTNIFAGDGTYAYSNSIATSPTAYFRLVSP